MFKYTIETDNDNNIVILWPCIPNRTYNLLISDFIDGDFIPLQKNIEVFQNMQKSFTDTGKDNNNDDDFDDETDILPSSAVDSRYYRIMISK